MLEFNSGQWLAKLHDDIEKNRPSKTELEVMRDFSAQLAEERRDRAAESDFMIGIAKRMCGF